MQRITDEKARLIDNKVIWLGIIATIALGIWMTSIVEFVRLIHG